MNIQCKRCGHSDIYLQPDLYYSDRGWIRCYTCLQGGEYLYRGHALDLEDSKWLCTESTESTTPTTYN